MTTTTNRENLGPAERIISQLLTYTDHAVHNRPGVVVPDACSTVGAAWSPATHKVEGEEKVVYRLEQRGKKTERVRLGVMNGDALVRDSGRVVAEYRPAGLFPEVVVWMYRQVAEVWKLDNEFAARWASHSFAQEHRDLKVVLAALMLVQSRKGDPVRDNGKVLFADDDFRAVGEAMMLLSRRDGRDFNPKLLLRVRDVLMLPAVSAINRDMGFGASLRRPFLGRWESAVDKWLRHREENRRLLDGLVKAGFRSTVIRLAQLSHYRPQSPKFFEALRWEQKQAADGRREIAIGAAVKAAESWAGLTERQICERVSSERPSLKRIVGLLPPEVGLTRAIAAAAVEAGSLSDKDLIIYSVTLEELGLLEVPEIKARWERAVRAADDQRAANVASRVRTTAVKEKLAEAADNAVKAAVAEVARGMRAYVIVDVSGSMQGSIAAAKEYLARFLQGFPLDRLHVATFSTEAREITIRHPSAAGVEQAFRGIGAGGGTMHRTAIHALRNRPPSSDEDAILIVVGDGGEGGSFAETVRSAGLRPMAIGFLKVSGEHLGIVENTARDLGVPCLPIDERVFADPYAVARTIRSLVAATPVSTGAQVARAPRETLIDQILKTPLLQKPAWA